MILDLLNEYKTITIDIIEKINDDNEALKLIERRGNILQKLLADENSKEEVKKAYLDMNLLELDEKLKEVINKEKTLVKTQIENMHKTREANTAYEKNKNINSFFSIKI